MGVAAGEGWRVEVWPCHVEEGAFTSDGELGVGTALTPLCGDALLPAPVIDSTANLMLGSRTESKADRAISFIGLR